MIKKCYICYIIFMDTEKDFLWIDEQEAYICDSCLDNVGDQ